MDGNLDLMEEEATFNEFVEEKELNHLRFWVFLESAFHLRRRSAN